nr:DUF308 domain-containing protein [Thiorhodococcus mannitoliphagus]
MLDKWGWLVGFGVVSTLLGVAGLGMTFGLTLAGVLFFGVLLLIGGVLQLFDAFKYSGWKGSLLHAAIALVYILAGFLMIVDPAGAAVALTLFLGSALIAAGVLRVVICAQHRDQPGWKWTAAGGLASVALGTVILIGWPVSGLWVIGLFIAIELLINGWTAIFLGLAARRAKRARDAGSAEVVA